MSSDTLLLTCIAFMLAMLIVGKVLTKVGEDNEQFVGFWQSALFFFLSLLGLIIVTAISLLVVFLAGFAIVFCIGFILQSFA